jgi:hypothetical protein
MLPVLRKYREDISDHQRYAANLETIIVVTVLTEGKGKVVHLHAIKAKRE